MPLNAKVHDVTQRIIERSAPSRRRYLDRMAAAKSQGPARLGLRHHIQFPLSTRMLGWCWSSSRMFWGE